MNWTIKEILSSVKGYMLVGNKNTIFKNITIDSRKVVIGDLFVTITGKNHKGIYFVNDAISNGCLGILVENKDITELNIEKIKKNQITCIVVNNTTYALGELAAYHRNRLNVKVVAITGSIGKTTTRQLVSKICTQRYSTASTLDNMNNHIGLPLSLLKVNNKHHVVVLELGMRKFGEIKRLSEICKPDIGVITNVAPVHIATLGNTNNIAKAKSEIMLHIKSTGTIVLNCDDPLVKIMSQTTKLKVVFFGESNNADIVANNIFVTKNGIKFLLITPDGYINIRFSLPSKALISNAVAASAVAFLLGCSNEEIKKGLESYKSYPGRMLRIQTKNPSVEIIDDAYNSSPLSLKNALETATLLKSNRLMINVIGDMMELGKESNLMHHKAGQLIAQFGCDRLYATGTFANILVKGALSENMPIGNTYVGSKEDIVEDIKKTIHGNCLILIKGSRGMRMERITKALGKIFNKQISKTNFK